MFLKTNIFPFFDTVVPRNLQKEEYKKKKMDSTAKSAFTNMDCLEFIDFAEQIYDLEFTEKPNYNKLRFELTKIMLD